MATRPRREGESFEQYRQALIREKYRDRRVVNGAQLVSRGMNRNTRRRYPEHYRLEQEKIRTQQLLEKAERERTTEKVQPEGDDTVQESEGLVSSRSPTDTADAV